MYTRILNRLASDLKTWNPKALLRPIMKNITKLVEAGE